MFWERFHWNNEEMTGIRWVCHAFPHVVQRSCVPVRGTKSGSQWNETFLLPFLVRDTKNRNRRKLFSQKAMLRKQEIFRRKKRLLSNKDRCLSRGFPFSNRINLRNSPLRSTIRDASLFYTYMCLGVYISACPDKWTERWNRIDFFVFYFPLYHLYLGTIMAYQWAFFCATQHEVISPLC